MDDHRDYTLYADIFAKHRVAELVKIYRTHGWSCVLKGFRGEYHGGFFDSVAERAIFTDMFFAACLEKLDRAEDSGALWQLAAEWLECRQPPWFCGGLSREEQPPLTLCCSKLREALDRLLAGLEDEGLDGFICGYQHVFIIIWRQFFLNCFSPLRLYLDDAPADGGEAAGAGVCALLRASLKSPSAPEGFDPQQVWSAAAPLAVKLVLSFWLLNIPYYGATPRHRERLLRYAPQLCRMLEQAQLPLPYVNLFVEELANCFWRASYIEGNNRAGLTALGDFSSSHMARLFPAEARAGAARGVSPGPKRRIGYVSANFGSHVVSYYMLNRVVYHDADRYEASIFALGDRQDETSGVFAQSCEHFWRFAPTASLGEIAAAIIASELDVLIYTDIGMDSATYLLAGMQLAPVQCALVGHGMTSGLPTIQYYISGDFEPPEAQEHYREELIRLPGLGAAQYPLPAADKAISRDMLGIPGDAVVFVSCANGIKLTADRDALLMRILREAPNAVLVLKPFPARPLVDHRLTARFLAAAEAAGVRERLFVVPPLNRPQDVLSLLALADVQLDTFPYGGWTTNMDALFMGVPVVTQEGAMARSRWGSHMLKALGIREGIAYSADEYVQWAVAFAADAGLRRRVSGQVKERVMATLYNGAAAQKPYEAALAAIIAGRLVDGEGGRRE